MIRENVSRNYKYLCLLYAMKFVLKLDNVKDIIQVIVSRRRQLTTYRPIAYGFIYNTTAYIHKQILLYNCLNV